MTTDPTSASSPGPAAGPSADPSEPGDTATATPPPPPPPPPSGAPDLLRGWGSLRRSRRPRTVAGVADGLARHLDVDPVIVKVLLVVLVFFGGAGLLLYGACWLLVPEEDATGGPGEAILDVDERSRVIGLAVVGVLAALAVLGDTLTDYGFPWPLATVAVVVLVIVLSRGERRRDRRADRMSGQDWSGSGPGSGSGSGPGWTWDTGPRAMRGWATQTTRVDLAKSPAPPRAEDADRRAHQPSLLSLALLASLVVLGVLAGIDLADAEPGRSEVLPAAYPAVVTVVCAVMLVVAGWWGRARGLLPVGITAALLTAVLSVLPTDPSIGRLAATPAGSGDVASTYRRDVGLVDLDLSAVADPGALAGRRIEVDVTIGRIEVVLPAGVDVRVRSTVEAGERRRVVDGPDAGRAGLVRVSSGRDDARTQVVERDVSPAPALVLDLWVGLGEITISAGGADG